MKLAPAAVAAYRSAAEHLADELAWLDLLLARHVGWLRATGQFNEDPLRGLYITDAEVAARLGSSQEPPRVYDHRIGSKRAVIEARLAESGELPLPALARRFGLDAFETACLLMATATAIDPRYEILFAYAQNDVSRKAPTVGLMLALLAESQEEQLHLLGSFSAGSRLVKTGLVHVPSAEAGKPLVSRGMTVDERVVFALLGNECGRDERVAPFVTDISEPSVPWRPDALLEQVEATLANGNAVVLDGQPDCGQRQLAYAASRRLGLDLIESDLSNPAAATLPAQELGRLLAREALISDAALLITARDAASDRRNEAVIAAAVRAGAKVVVATDPCAVSVRDIARSVPSVEIATPAPTALQRSGWWRAAFEAQGGEHEPALPSRLGLALRSGPDAISAAVKSAAVKSASRAEFSAIAGVARHAARSEVPALARLVKPHWHWDDLVLPEKHTARLKDICAELQHGPRVLHEWRFSQKSAAGQNGVVLFSGASGTGKTMAASLIAGSIGLDLYRVDLALMFNKYIGETEKNLDRLFSAMESTNAVVFFDEADVLFGKRTEIKDAHDRFANLSVAYLLQRIETYEGLVILATNLAGNMDDAFSRRLRHVVHFPLPDIRMRRRLWDLAFPAQAPLGADIDLDQLAERFELTGGNIRNVALAAAYLAAAEDRPIGQRHALQAVARELEKLGRPPTRDDFGDTYGMLSPAEGG